MKQVEEKKTDSTSNIIVTDNAENCLKQIILNYNSKNVFFLTDENTLSNCIPVIQNIINPDSRIFTIKSGEENKNLHTLESVWNFLSKNNADRKSLLVNLGGGVLTDLGGFAASTFKRGINFVNIPTTLLGQVDASAGGKTGINFNGLKNEIGIINQAESVIVDSFFLKTLNQREFLSGFAEMVKHSLLSDKNYFNELMTFDVLSENKNYLSLNILIEKSIKIKSSIVEQDPYEKGIRKALNFGHTFGHAFESLYFEKGLDLKHGEAVSQGIICELFLSNKKESFPVMELLNITGKIMLIYNKVEIKTEDFSRIIELMFHDKKNSDGQINCTLISQIGKPVIDHIVSKSEVSEALNYYLQIFM